MECSLTLSPRALEVSHIEGTSVDAPGLDAPRGDTFPTQQEEILWVTTPIEVGGLADNFFRVSVGNPQRGALESPVPKCRLQGK